jgi:thiol-disulfide isomerase/thioredoxin
MRPTSVAARWLPRDVVNATKTGGVFTLIAYGVMITVFVLELRRFLSTDIVTELSLDRADGSLLQVNFQVDIFDIECRNLKIAFIDEFGEEKMDAISNDYKLRAIDASGRGYGHAFRPEPESLDYMMDVKHSRRIKELQEQDGKEELDSDWDSSHDGFKHKNFEHVIEAHEFVLVNFFAGWCSHCKQFHPLWTKMANEINPAADHEARKFLDRDGKGRLVRMMKVNCVDFGDLCKRISIDAYPTIRLYKQDGSFSVFEGSRREEEIVRWVERMVKMRSYGWGKDVDLFEKGCNFDGHLQIPRVPGYLEFTVGEGDQSVDPTMANISHTVKHLSFSDPVDGRYHRRSWVGLTNNQLNHVSPMDGQLFVTDGYHQAHQHHIKIVSTVTQRGATAYQFDHYDRVSTFPASEIPQTRFYFEIEPFSVWIKSEAKRWYDFGTSALALTGGIFVVMRLLSNGVVTAASVVVKDTRGGLVRRGPPSGGSGRGQYSPFDFD